MIGQTLSHFKITAKLGEGGMGEVYLAEDTKLGREVAIKVLPAAFTEDAERFARFEREAHVLASLNHPNIASIYEVGLAGGVHFLAMELAPGEDLADRLERGPVLLEEALPIALQIAAALEAAHERSIVHRDLKPANVKVTPGGEVKVLDFGLAKAWEDSPADKSMSMSPTLTAQMTQAGVILGTAGYMSPEQARGQEVDPRADIWAFGVILWEMVTGDRLFRENTVSDTLAAVLKTEIDLESLPGDLPRRVRRLVERCLERDARRRLQAIGEARIALEDAYLRPDEATDDDAPTYTSGWLRWLPVAVAAGLLAIAVAWTSRAGSEQTPPRLRRLSVPMPNTALLRSQDQLYVSLSPDGQTLVVAGYSETDDAFHLRRLTEEESTPIEATAGAHETTFSPDGRWLAFSRNDGIFRVDLRSGAVTRVVRTDAAPSGFTWSPDGHVYYVDFRGQLWRVAAEGGGEPELIAKPDPEKGELRLQRPYALPSGKAILMHVVRDSDNPPEIHILDIDSGSRRHLGLQGIHPVYSTEGYLLFASGERVLVTPFDEEALELTGEPFALSAEVWIEINTLQLAVSEEGSMAYLPPDLVGARQPVLVSRNGTVSPLLPDMPEVRGLADPRFSPDGTRVVFTDVVGGLFLLDLGSGTISRVSEDGFYPVWSPDGKMVAYGSTGVASYNLILRHADLRPETEVLLDWDNNLRTAEWSPHGFIFREQIPGKGMDLKLLPPDLDGEPQPLLEDEADELAPTISPDGRWLAFQSGQSGRDEIYLTAFPVSRGRTQISTRGGRAPAWSPESDEIYYFEGNVLMAAQLTFDAEPRVSGREALFQGDYAQYRWHRQYDVHPDGDSFLMIAISGGRNQVKLVLDWAAELKRELSR